ncbi:Phosphatidylcholine:ceramide cholinephosphotransferase 1 [Parelaphostrongylus tenuis]|uniref:Phosphatidylcholine:ceramide cholinephosphotransferase 1 n=1 Tax=Parelaphostrongylus tenuis TaxID=148309 RepID=A0AAD5ME28_PARTN|nr:Phosphatidylcholine:ceramide cholinephosphotransferase 1 [Parelaphostrongylus tenuis]
MDDEPTSSGSSSSSRGLCSAAMTRRVCGGSTDSTASDSDTADDAPLLTDVRIPQQVNINMLDDEKPASPHDRFPKERLKALISFILLAFAAVLNEIVLSFVHERVPEQPPLPDITFSLVTYYQNGLKICEYIMLSSFASVLLLMLFHRHRWIMFRRLMMVGSLLYLMRCVTMIVTQVPVADPNFLCSPKFGKNGTFWEIVLRGLKMVAGVGLNVSGKDTLCGDYIYSGHTIVLVVSALFIGEYSPRRWRLLHVFYWLVALTGVVFLVISRGHYTLDVILSYFICTRVFWSYHTMVAHPTLRLSAQNHHRKEFWFPLFNYMECNVMKPVPRRFDCPLPTNRLRSVLRRRVANSRIE